MEGYKYYFGYRYIGQFDYGFIPLDYEYFDYAYFDRYEDAERALNEAKENPNMQLTEIMKANF